MMTLPMPAASATAEPDMPEKIIEAMMLTWPSPPRSRPTSATQKVSSRSRDRAGIHDVGGDDEERHRQNDEAVVEALDDLLGGEPEILPLDGEIDDGRNDHRERDRRPQDEQDGKAGEAGEKGDGHGRGAPSRVSGSAPRARRQARKP